MRKEPLIGIHLDLSEAFDPQDVVSRFAYHAAQGILHAEVQQPWTNPLTAPLASLNPSELIKVFRNLLDALSEVSRSSGLPFALFVDEYDAPVIRTLHDGKTSEEYLAVNQFMTDFFTLLKARPHIPFQFITGSSRLPMEGFWSGPNNITDLSSEPNLAHALGYSWEQIEQYFPTQLRWLQNVHKLDPQQLRTEMEDWYDRHRWSSSESKIHVFNPWSVNHLMRRGSFQAYWSETGGKTKLLHSKLLVKDLVTLLALSYDDPASMISIAKTFLSGSKLPKQAGKSLELEAQKALLVGAGMLAIHPDYQENGKSSRIQLTIPNRDARQALLNVVTFSLPDSFGTAKIESLILSKDICALVTDMEKFGALRVAINSVADPDSQVTEELLSATFVNLMFSANLSETVEYRPLLAVKEHGSGKALTADHTFHLADQKSTLILEFKMTASRQGQTLSRQVVLAFAQCLSKYKGLVKEGNTGHYSVVVFDGTTASQLEVEAVMGPLMEEQVNQLFSDSSFDFDKYQKKPDDGSLFDLQTLKEFDLQTWCQTNHIQLYLRPKTTRKADKGDTTSEASQEEKK